ncbi:MAG: thiamine phosphate synthase [Chlorobium sp.]|nr:MAG: thiamine phosphate synthase [Chlorobium sp.]
MVQNKLQQTPLPRLLLVSSGEEDPDNGSRLLAQLKLLSGLNACMVQIREKQLTALQLFVLAQKAREIKLPEGTLLLMNERTDIALACGLDGVHLPENAPPLDKLRLIGPQLLFGCSVHSVESARIAEESGADYLLFGPVFDTPSKRKYGAPQGLEKLGELCRKTTLPVFAIGGITPMNALTCLDEGAYGTAALTIFRESRGFIENIEKFNRILYP